MSLRYFYLISPKVWIVVKIKGYQNFVRWQWHKRIEKFISAEFRGFSGSFNLSHSTSFGWVDEALVYSKWVMLSTKCPHPPEGCKISKAPLFSEECKFLGGRKLSPSKTKLGHSYRKTGLLTQRQLNWMNQLEFSGGSESCERERMLVVWLRKQTNERTNRNEFCTLLLQLQECYLSASYSSFFLGAASSLNMRQSCKR